MSMPDSIQQSVELENRLVLLAWLNCSKIPEPLPKASVPTGAVPPDSL